MILILSGLGGFDQRYLLVCAVVTAAFLGEKLALKD
jgi:hypothetical protein